MDERQEAEILSEGIRTFYYDKNAHSIIASYIRQNLKMPCIVLCIGTDRYIGDCLGPLIGTFLSKLDIKWPVFGTLETPVHAVNLRKTIMEIKNKYPHHTIIAIDACLGTSDCIGGIQIRNGCIHPGKGVGKKLPPIGDISIIGIVDAADYGDFLSMHNIRLNLVMKMAEVISKGLYEGLK